MIILAFGANIPSVYGPPEISVKRAMAAMANVGHIIGVSSLWLSEPVPSTDVPWFYNSIMALECDLKPKSLLFHVKKMEQEFGRSADYAVGAPRPLDIDIIDFHGRVEETAGLSLPHPRAHERAFVLYPLREVAPDWGHPVLRLSVDEMIVRLPENQKLHRIEAQEAS